MQFQGGTKYEQKVRRDSVGRLKWTDADERMLTCKVVRSALDADDGSEAIELLAHGGRKQSHTMPVYIATKKSSTVELYDEANVKAYVDDGWTVVTEKRSL